MSNFDKPISVATETSEQTADCLASSLKLDGKEVTSAPKQQEGDDNRFESVTLEVDPTESKEHLDEGLRRVEKIITELKGTFVGIYEGGDLSKSKPLVGRSENVLSLEDFLGRSLVEWIAAISSRDRISLSPVYDDQLTRTEETNYEGHGLIKFCIGERIIARVNVSRFYYADSTESTEATYSVVAYNDKNKYAPLDDEMKRVTPEDYEVFMETVQAMLRENYKHRGIRFFNSEEEEDTEREQAYMTERLWPQEIEDRVRELKK